MATMIVTHRVSSFDNWKKAFEGHAAAREKAGFTGGSVHRDHSDPNLVTVLLKTGNLDAAKRFADSPELEEVMRNAGVQGPPDIRYLDDV